MIRIAAVSSKEFIHEIIKYEDTIAEITITPYVYENPSDILSVADQIHDCDVVLFAGPLPYFICKDKIKEKKWPAVYIPSDEYVLMATLFHTYINRPDSHRLSIDIPVENYAEQVAKEMNLQTSNWFITISSYIGVEKTKTFDADAIIRFHQELFQTGQTQYALTSVDYVHSKLKEMGIPSTSMIIPEKAIVDSIQKAITIGKLAISKNAEISIGILIFNQQESTLASFGGFKQDTVLVLQQSLLELVKETETTIRLIGMDQFIIYGTRGSVERFLDARTLKPFIQEANQFGMTVSMGFGFGITAKEAEENAHAALYHAKKDVGGNNIFLANSEKEIIGPLNSAAKTFSLKSKDATILNVAEKTNSSVSTITKLMQFSKVQREKGFTTIELSEYLGISRRSAERLLKKFLDRNLAKKVGEEQPYKQGRPRAVYLLTIE